ncbi:MAG: CBS domain-containing protein [Myxococcales bacterium]|nr:CBS domain-containing protein [Myxococcales bacterium]
MSLPRVRDFMVVNFYRFAASMDIREAVPILIYETMSGAPVVDRDGALVGMLSERDCLSLLTHGSEMPHGHVANFMTKEVETLTPDIDIYYVAGKFLSCQYRNFPVVEGGELDVLGISGDRNFSCFQRLSGVGPGRWFRQGGVEIVYEAV